MAKIETEFSKHLRFALKEAYENPVIPTDDEFWLENEDGEAVFMDREGEWWIHRRYQFGRELWLAAWLEGFVAEICYCNKPEHYLCGVHKTILKNSGEW